MIGWKKVDPKNPPSEEGKRYVFCTRKGQAMSGAIAYPVILDPWGYPLWVAGETGVRYEAHWYTERTPTPDERLSTSEIRDLLAGRTDSRVVKALHELLAWRTAKVEIKEAAGLKEGDRVYFRGIPCEIVGFPEIDKATIERADESSRGSDDWVVLVVYIHELLESPPEFE